MIAYIQGKITYKDPTTMIVEASGGIGYQLRISLNTFSQLKDLESIKIHTFMHVKEDAHTLYGFVGLEEKKMFLELIGISGVGPGTALMVLSSLTSNELAEAIISEDVRTIQAVKGIGAKTAQRIVLELKDKVKKDTLISQSEQKPMAFSGNKIRNEALNALLTLGINKAVAEKNLDTVIKTHGADVSLEILIKNALKQS